MNLLKYLIFIFLLMHAGQNKIRAQSSTSVEMGILLGDDGDFINNYAQGFRNGYMIGLKGDYGTYEVFISPGIYFQSFTINNNYKKVKPFVRDERINMLKAKALLGYKTYFLTRKTKFKFGGGITANYIINIAKNDKGVNFKTLSDTYWGYTLDTGFEIFSISLSVSYEKPFKEILKIDDKRSYFDFLVFSLSIEL